MKKIFLILVFTLPLLLGQTVYQANSVVALWDPPAGLVDGSPVDLEQITYEVVIAPVGDKAELQLVDEVSAPTAAITFPSEDQWLIGVRAVRTVGEDRSYSEYLWSDETANPFTVLYLIGPAAVSDIRIQE